MRRLLGTLAAAVVVGAALPAAAGAANATFSNPTPFVGPASPIAIGKADPNPSNITVSGMTGVVTDVNVFLTGVSATNPDDIEILLVAPFGQTTMLWDDAGGATDISNFNLSFNDQGAGPILDATAPTDGVGYEPSNYDMPGLEAMINTGSPPPPYGLTLSLSQGTDPNGTWSLYVGDDALGMETMGISGGWSISITTTDVPPTPTTATPVVVNTPVAAPKKKCKKGRKLKRGKCVRKKRKK